MQTEGKEATDSSEILKDIDTIAAISTEKKSQTHIPEINRDDHELIHSRKYPFHRSANVHKSVAVGRSYHVSEMTTQGYPFLSSNYLGETPCVSHIWDDADTNSRNEEEKIPNDGSMPCSVSFISIPVDMLQADAKPEKSHIAQKKGSSMKDDMNDKIKSERIHESNK